MAANLERTFEKWQSSQKEPDEYIWLQASKNTIEILFRGYEINIGFPNDINDFKSYTFTSKEKSNEGWISRLNSEIQSNPPPSFSDILSLAVTFYTKRNEKPQAENDSDSEMEEDQEMDEDEDQEMDEDEDIHHEEEEEDDDDFENEHFQEALHELKLKKIWAKKDKEIRAKLGEKKKDQKVKSIFSSDAAFGVLTNDLFSIMGGNLGFSAQPIDDNIYHWNVKIFGFDPQSKIYSQLQQVKKEFEYDYIEIQALFTEDLYPFYPPTIKVIRPRLTGFFLGRISHLELLKLENWNPICDMKYVLNYLKDILEKHGQLDVNNPMNSLNNNSGSYSTLEHFLLRLEILTDTPPRANLKYGLEYTIVKPKTGKTTPPPTATTTTTTTHSGYGYGNDNKNYWAKGTGYGRGSQNGWNIDAFLAAQKERDNEVKSLLLAIEIELKNPNVDIPFDILEESCLVPFLESYCRDISLLDVERHSDLWSALLSMMQTLVDTEKYFILFTLLSYQAKSLGDYIREISTEIEMVFKRLDSSQLNTANYTLQNNLLKLDKSIQSRLKAMNEEIKKLEATSRLITGNGADKDSAQSMEAKYLSALKPLQFDICDLSKFITKPQYAVQQARTLRIAQEQGTLFKSLPLNFESSVFARVDEKSIDVMQVLITGPNDTPYSCGCFLFNVIFSPNYPQNPPSVTLVTTGGGSVRFNPNLYNTGKVCLSLLGTWSGGAGENWNPSTSTLLQVLVSIQSLILVPEPFFNEPGYEAQMGSAQGKTSSLNYNWNIQTATMEWAMIDMIKKPPAPFKDVIRNHFLYSKDKIKAQCAKWVEDSSKSTYYSKMLKNFNTLVQELDALN